MENFLKLKFIWIKQLNFVEKVVCKNIFGRRSHFININDKNYNVRNFQERAAINAPIQGSASEIMRLAMIRLNKRLNEKNNQKTKDVTSNS